MLIKRKTNYSLDALPTGGKGESKTLRADTTDLGLLRRSASARCITLIWLFA